MGGERKRDPFAVLHCNALGDKLTEDERDVGQDDRNDDNGERVDQSLPFGEEMRVAPLQGVYDIFAKAVCGKGTAEEACKGNRNLDRCKESGRVFGQRLQGFGTLISRFGKLIQL